MRPQDLKTILLPFRLGTFASEADESKQGWFFSLVLMDRVFKSGDYLGTLLRISQSTSTPPSFFSWNQPAVGVIATPSCPWPKNGFTLFAWVCVESYSQTGTRLPL